MRSQQKNLLSKGKGRQVQRHWSVWGTEKKLGRLGHNGRWVKVTQDEAGKVSVPLV